MASLADNPFAAVTILVAPAILTNASSVLCLGTGNRLARVVDRTRLLRSELTGLEPNSARREAYVRQLDRLKVRSHLILGALRLFYTSLGSFAAAALISIVGAVFSDFASLVIFKGIASLALVSGSVGVAGIVGGCALMVHETRLAVRNLEEEARFQSNRG
jgi:hypothetical protein